MSGSVIALVMPLGCGFLIASLVMALIDYKQKPSPMNAFWCWFNGALACHAIVGTVASTIAAWPLVKP